jgi:hypothetical protein
VACAAHPLRPAQAGGPAAVRGGDGGRTRGQPDDAAPGAQRPGVQGTARPQAGPVGRQLRRQAPAGVRAFRAARLHRADAPVERPRGRAGHRGRDGAAGARGAPGAPAGPRAEGAPHHPGAVGQPRAGRGGGEQLPRGAVPRPPRRVADRVALRAAAKRRPRAVLRHGGTRTGHRLTGAGQPALDGRGLAANAGAADGLRQPGPSRRALA